MITEGFVARDASPADLLRYGFPPKPDKSAYLKGYAAWEDFAYGSRTVS
jgi:hypothetical protein